MPGTIPPGIQLLHWLLLFFMVGKLPEKIKPTIMIVSDDKPRRKAAFQAIKSKNILVTYPGFELGHCILAAEFEDLRLLGSKSTASTALTSISASTESYENMKFYPGEPKTEVQGLLSTKACAFESPDMMKPTRLYFPSSSNPSSHHSASATCGGLVRYRNLVLIPTVAHALDPIRRATISLEPHSDSSSESDDFEITGMDDWDEGDEEDAKALTAVTSSGSKPPSEFSDSEESLLGRHDSQLLSKRSIRTRIATEPSVSYEEPFITEHCEDKGDVLRMCEQVGSVVDVTQEFDLAWIKPTPNVSTPNLFRIPSIEYLPEADLTAMSITIKTTHHSEIRGQCSPTPFYTRLLGTSSFLELYGVKSSTPLSPGDSGSWAYSDKGNLAGLIVAGNLQTGSCLLLPSRVALRPVDSMRQPADPIQQSRLSPVEYGNSFRSSKSKNYHGALTKRESAGWKRFKITYKL
ncbi:hypothetical protein GGS24DRAFT_478912 [Hypoxylon argillaceum]|nr:hypothetical protein GGS24DRAFT_478912 [Hypoxylon argillaceum]